MSTKELVRKVAENMPSGWRLRNFFDGINPVSDTTPAVCCDLCNDDIMVSYDIESDSGIGLAPLTALLKQELVKAHEQFGTFQDDTTEPSWECIGRHDAPPLSEYVSLSREACDTEFEAVATAYLAARGVA